MKCSGVVKSNAKAGKQIITADEKGMAMLWDLVKTLK